MGGAVRLNHNMSDIVINWAGGLHHAKKSEVGADQGPRAQAFVLSPSGLEQQQQQPVRGECRPWA